MAEKVEWGGGDVEFFKECQVFSARLQFKEYQWTYIRVFNPGGSDLLPAVFSLTGSDVIRTSGSCVVLWNERLKERADNKQRRQHPGIKRSYETLTWGFLGCDLEQPHWRSHYILRIWDQNDDTLKSTSMSQMCFLFVDLRGTVTAVGEVKGKHAHLKFTGGGAGPTDRKGRMTKRSTTSWAHTAVCYVVSEHCSPSNSQTLKKKNHHFKITIIHSCDKHLFRNIY